MADTRTQQSLLFSLPDYIVQCLLSDEYQQILHDLSSAARLKAGSENAFDRIVLDLFARTLHPNDLPPRLVREFGLDEPGSRTLARDIVGEFMIPFPVYFLNSIDALEKLGGNTEQYLSESRMMLVLLRHVNKNVQSQLHETESIDLEREYAAVKALFENNIVDYLSLGAGPDIISLNNLIVHLLASYDGYHQELLQSLYRNKQLIGNGVLHTEQGGSDPSVGAWLRHFVAASGGDASSLQIAKYFAESSDVKKCLPQDRGILKKLIEMFRVLKNYPASLSRLSPDNWEVIPTEVVEQPLTHQGLKIPIGKLSPQQNAPVSLPRAPQAPTIEKETEKPLPPKPIVVPTSEPPKAVAPEPKREPQPESKPLSVPLPPPPAVAPQKPPSPPSAPERRIVQSVPDVSHPFFAKDLPALTREVVKLSGVSISTDDAARLESIVITRLKNVRTSLEVREKLMELKEQGGLGLSKDTAERLVRHATLAADLIAQGKLLSMPASAAEKKDEKELIPPHPTLDALLPREQPLKPRETSFREARPHAPSALGLHGLYSPAPVAPLDEKRKAVMLEPVVKKPLTPISPLKPPRLPEPEEHHANLSTIPPSPVVLKLPKKDTPLVVPPIPSAPPIPPISVTIQIPKLEIKDVDGVPTIIEKKPGGALRESTGKSEVSPPATPPTLESMLSRVILPAIPTPTSHTHPDLHEVERPVIVVPPIGKGAQQKEERAKVKATAVEPALKDAHVIPVKVEERPRDKKQEAPAEKRTPPHLLNTIEEIRSLSLKDFRRYSDDAEKTANHIFDKIQALEKESLQKKIQAIDAWRESEINSLYLEIGQQSMARGVMIEKIIEERNVAGKPALTSVEFDAILDLNDKLRFS